MAIGELWVEGARPVGDEVVGGRLPEHEDVDTREDVALLDDVYSHAHQRRLNRRAQPHRACAANDNLGRGHVRSRAGAQLPILGEGLHE